MFHRACVGKNDAINTRALQRLPYDIHDASHQVQSPVRAAFRQSPHEVRCRRTSKKSSPTAPLASNVLANTFKLVGNSIYGKAVTNKETQTDAVYANGFSATYLANLQETRSSSTPRRLHTRLREAQHAAVCVPVYAKVSASGHIRNRSNGHKFLLLRGNDADARHLHQV